MNNTQFCNRGLPPALTISNTQELENFIASRKKRLKAILKRLRWSEDLILKNFNTNSLTLDNDLLPDTTEEQPFPDSCATRNSVVIDTSQLQTLVGNSYARIPEKFSDLQLNFSREQKLQLYEHVVENTEKLSEPEMAVPISDEPKSMTFAEILAQKKKEKKKRHKYRTSKPTHIEEVRSLVELQMQALEQYLKPKLNDGENINNHKKHKQESSTMSELENKDKILHQSCSSLSKSEKFIITKYAHESRATDNTDRGNRSRSRNRTTSRRRSTSKDSIYYKETQYQNRSYREKTNWKRKHSRSNSGERSYSRTYSRDEHKNGHGRRHNGKLKSNGGYEHRRSRSYSYERDYVSRDRRNTEYNERSSKRDGYNSKYIKRQKFSSHNEHHAYYNRKY